ncbi:NADH-quinone oxidoreductase subunit J [soil metagenome]
MQVLLYYTLFAITIAFALGVLLNKNTIKSAMNLIGVMVCLAVNYLIMQQEFVFVTQIIVYAGAILVVVVFVIMLLNLKEVETTHWYLRNARYWGGILAIVFFVVMAYSASIFANADVPPGIIKTQEAIVASKRSEVVILATMMITRYIVPFILTSVLLLVAVIGAIVMAKRRDEDGEEIVLEEEPV